MVLASDPRLPPRLNQQHSTRRHQRRGRRINRSRLELNPDAHPLAQSTTNDRTAPSPKISAPRLPPGDLFRRLRHTSSSDALRPYHLPSHHVRSRGRVRQRRATLAARPSVDLPQRRRLNGPSSPAGAVRVHDQRGKPIGVALWSPRPRSRCAWSIATPTPTLDAHGGASASAHAIARREPLATRRERVPPRARRRRRMPIAHLRSLRPMARRAADERRPRSVSRRDRRRARRARATRRHSRAQRRPACARRNGCRSASSCCAATCPTRSKSTSTACGSSPRRGAARRPARSSTSARIAYSIGERARGRALDCFSYHGSFALHLARRAESRRRARRLRATRSRAPRRTARATASRTSSSSRRTRSTICASEQTAGERFDTIVLDPPAFAKNTRRRLPAAIRGYKDINLRAMRICSRRADCCSPRAAASISRSRSFSRCSHDAAADSGRRLALRAITGQPLDHPEVLTIPETGYLKGALLEALD